MTALLSWLKGSPCTQTNGDPTKANIFAEKVTTPFLVTDNSHKGIFFLIFLTITNFFVGFPLLPRVIFDVSKWIMWSSLSDLYSSTRLGFFYFTLQTTINAVKPLEPMELPFADYHVARRPKPAQTKHRPNDQNILNGIWKPLADGVDPVSELTHGATSSISD